jgi:hypothetical protein
MGEIGLGEQINLVPCLTQGDMTVEESNKLEPVSQTLRLSCFNDFSIEFFLHASDHNIFLVSP